MTRPDTGNTPLMRAMVGKRSSNAAGKHQDKRNRRRRTRGAALAAAVRDTQSPPYRPD